MKHPNIVFIISDDHRYSAIGEFGIENVHTPVLDNLVKRGTVLSQMRTMNGFCGAVCIPSRACINTGKNVLSIINASNNDDNWSAYNLPSEFQTMGQILQQSNYVTYGIGKWHNDHASFNRSFAGGAEIFFGGMSSHTEIPVYDYQQDGYYTDDKCRIENKFSTNLFTDAAVSFIEDYQQPAPFFLYVSFTAPHDPRTPPAPYDTMYNPDNIKLPLNFMPAHPFDNGELNIRDEQLAEMPRNSQEICQHIADYYGMISNIDTNIGLIIEALEERNILNNTIIVYTADHGLALGQHGLMGKQNLYEHSLRTPFIVSGPGIPIGCKANEIVMEMDILPSLLDMTDVPIPKNIDGISFVNMLTNNSNKCHNYGFALYCNYQRMITDGVWKLIRYYRDSTTGKGEDRVQLFNIQDDPWEMNDLSSLNEYKEKILKLNEALLNWQQFNNDKNLIKVI